MTCVAYYYRNPTVVLVGGLNVKIWQPLMFTLSENIMAANFFKRQDQFTTGFLCLHEHVLRSKTGEKTPFYIPNQLSLLHQACLFYVLYQ